MHQRPNANSAVVPDVKLRAGDLSELTTPLYIPYDPARGTYAGNQIKTISPVAQAILTYIPTAPAGTPINRKQERPDYLFPSINDTADHQLLTRFDQHLSKSNMIYGTFFNSHQTAAGFLDPTNYLSYKNAGDLLLKNFSLGEGVKGIFRFEAFNVLNHTNLNPPTNTLTAGNFTAITSAYDPRILQFALRVAF